MKDIEDDTNKLKDIPCSQIQRINIVKMTVFHTRQSRFSIISIKILAAFFTELGQNMLKFVWKQKESWAGELGHRASTWTGPGTGLVSGSLTGSCV